MPQDEIKSLVNSVNMVKNMVESIVTAVQDRFKDYDNVVVSLKERVEKLETRPSGSGQTVSTDSSELIAKIEQLGKRLDSLNERILLIEATKSVAEKTTTETPQIDIAKADVGEFQEPTPVIEPEPTPVIEPEPTPVIEPEPTPVIEPEEVVEVEPKVPSEPLVKEAPTIPVPSPPESTPAIKKEKPEPTPAVEAPKTEIPSPSTIPQPEAEKTIAQTTSATQVTEAPVERDVSPISKEVQGNIPVPPSQSEIPTPTSTAQIQPQVTKEDPTPPVEGKSAELFGEAVSGDKAELLKALKKLEDL